jgi:hypothetical protein
MKINQAIKVYIAAPYSKGDIAINVRNAIQAGEKISTYGMIPYIPHLTHFWHLQFNHSADYWYKYDFHWLDVCDCLLRLPGESHGADEEMKRMVDNHRIVFLDMESLINWYLTRCCKESDA